MCQIWSLLQEVKNWRKQHLRSYHSICLGPYYAKNLNLLKSTTWSYLLKAFKFQHRMKQDLNLQVRGLSFVEREF